MINKALLLGTVEDAPVIQTLPNGTRVANFVLVTTESWVDKKTGEKKANKERHRIAVFSDRVVEIITARVTAGTTVYVEGQIEGRTWTDGDGVSRSYVDIVIRILRGTLTIIEQPKV